MINIGIISVSDRAFNKVYKDEGIPEIEKILSVDNDFKILNRQIIPDDKVIIKNTLTQFCDEEKLDIILTPTLQKYILFLIRLYKSIYYFKPDLTKIDIIPNSTLQK